MQFGHAPSLLSVVQMCPHVQALLHKELDAQSERRDRAANRAEKLLKKLRQQRPHEAAVLELDIELSQLQESNQALLQVRAAHALMLTCQAGLLMQGACP